MKSLQLRDRSLSLSLSRLKKREKKKEEKFPKTRKLIPPSSFDRQRRVIFFLSFFLTRGTG